MEELGKTSHVAGGGSIGSGAEHLVGFYVVYGVHLLMVVGTLSGTNSGVGTLPGTNHIVQLELRCRSSWCTFTSKNLHCTNLTGMTDSE